MLGRIRLVLWALVAVAAGAGIYLSLGKPAARPPASEQTPLTDFGGPFTLTGGDGKPFGSTQLAGKPYVIFFGFTHCPDVCPTTLARLTKLRKQLGDGDEPFRILFVTVDPERDGPKDVAAYSGLFGTPVIGLTGSQATIDRVKKQFGIFSEKVGGGDTYSVTHTATVFLVDGDGRFQATIAPDENDATALKKLENLVGR